MLNKSGNPGYGRGAGAKRAGPGQSFKIEGSKALKKGMMGFVSLNFCTSSRLPGPARQPGCPAPGNPCRRSLAGLE